MAALRKSAILSIAQAAAGAFLVILLASGCVARSPRVVRIGLVAPFEGRFRATGDQVIPAARLAVREYASKFAGNGLVIEIVAYDDRGSAGLAIEQARKLVADPQVMMVIGHWREETTRAALPIYQEAGLPLITFSASDYSDDADVWNLSPSSVDMHELAEDWADTQSDIPEVLIDSGGDFPVWMQRADRGLYFVTGAVYPGDHSDNVWTASRIAAFVEAYEKGSLGSPPGPLSIAAYEATWLAIDQILAEAGLDSAASPLPAMSFDSTHRRADSPVFLYQLVDSKPRLVLRLR